MFEWFLQLYQHPDFWRYVSIPFFAAIVGWGTNWIAVKLTFLPTEFVGIKPWLGWQGIIPSKAEKMAKVLMVNTLDKIGDLEELFQAMEPEKVAEQILKSFDPHIEEMVDNIVNHEHREAWRKVPGAVKHLVYKRVRQQLPLKLDELMQDVAGNIEDYLDPGEMVATQLQADKALLNRIFLECGEPEFKFVVKSGFYFGFAFGLIQMLVWVFLPQWWVLPVFGFLVGWATNWIALNVIFSPLNPVKFMGITVHGLFLKRQEEVSHVFSKLVTREVFTIRNVVHAMLNGSRKSAALAKIEAVAIPAVDDAVGVAELPLKLALGADYKDLQRGVVEQVIEVAPMPFDDEVFNTQRARQLDKLIVARMEEMSPADFQDLLRPAFKEDEFKLIIIGALLGFGVGVGQLLLLFGHTLVETVIQHAPKLQGLGLL